MSPPSTLPDPADSLLPDNCCAEIRQLLAYWRRIHPDRGLPGRRHFDPIDVPALLPHIWMIDVFRDPWQFRFRLAGTAIVDFIEIEATGKWCDEVYRDFANSEAYHSMHACADTGRPLYRTGKLLSQPDRTYIQAQRLHLPLATDGVTTDIILCMTRYLPLGRG